MSARVVLLHGFTGSPASWAPVLEQLDDVQAFVPALTGHGAEAVAVDFLDEVHRLLAGVDAWRGEHLVHLAGYSLGARVALAMAVEQPDAFASVTLIGVNPGPRSETERSERRAADAKWIELLERGIEPFVDEWEKLPLWASQERLPAAVRKAQRETRLLHDPKGLQASLRATGLAEMPDLRTRLPELRVPVTLMAGEQDAKFLALAREAAALLPNARVITVPDAGHNLLLERPEAVAHVLGRGSR